VLPEPISSGAVSAMLLGFAVAAPIGPVGLACIARGLDGQLLGALLTGLGSATVHGALVLLTTAALASELAWARDPGVLRVSAAGTGACLILIGLRTWRRRPQALRGLAPPLSLWICLRPYLTGAALALNPGTALFLVTAAPALASSYTSAAPVSLALSTFSGSAIWWVILSSTVTALRQRISSGQLRKLNKGTGLLLVVVGVALGITSVR
jgi:threonine/homoserine/homoserine lactone efflux protein